MANVAICTPHAGRVPPEYYRNVLSMQGQPDGLKHRFFHVEIDHAIVGKARNVCMETARANVKDLDVIWFIDDDVLVPPHAGKIVDEAMQLGVVSGLYFNRHNPYTPQIYRRATEVEYVGPNVMYWPIMEYPEGLMMVDACGGGCLAVRTDVLTKLEAHAAAQKQGLDAALADVQGVLDTIQTIDYPEFAEGLKSASLHAGRSLLELFNHRPVMSPFFEFTDAKGEDMYFCEKTREIGQVTWCDTTIKCGHLSSIPIDETHFKFLKENNMIRIIGADGQPIGSAKAVEQAAPMKEAE